MSSPSSLASSSTARASSSSSSSFEAPRASSTLPCTPLARPLASRVRVAVCRVASRLCDRITTGRMNLSHSFARRSTRRSLFLSNLAPRFDAIATSIGRRLDRARRPTDRSSRERRSTLEARLDKNSDRSVRRSVRRSVYRSTRDGCRTRARRADVALRWRARRR